MKSVSRVLLLGALLLLPFSTAHAQAPSVSPLSNISMNAGSTATMNVVAVDLNGDAITLTSTLPAFATLNPPTTGTGSVSTTLTLAPTASDVGVFTGSVKATAGGEVDSSTFTITVVAAGSNQAPVVTAPATQTATEGVNLSFTVTAVDADADAITSLSATGLPSGATFTPNGTNTSGTFSWTPGFTQAGDYDVVFTATSGVLTGGATTHIHVANAEQLAVSDIADVTLAAGTTATVNVTVSTPTSGTTTLTSSLPSWATLNAPTTSTGASTLTTTITLAPPTGTTGTFQASVTATNGTQTDTETFSITVTSGGGGGGGLTAKATMLGNYNTHRKFICFRVEPVNGSFDVRDVNLSGLTLRYSGSSITALAGKTHIGFDCEGDDDDGDCENGDCEDDDEDECEDCPFDSLNCEASLHVCFSASEMRDLFGDSALPASLVDATVSGTLTTGESFTATIDPKFPGYQANREDRGKSGLHSKVRPNPVNPATKITFRLSKAGRTQVLVYDLQGRLMKTVLDENRSVGDHEVTWNGSNSRSATVPSGVYFVRIKAPQGEEVQRVTVLK